MFLHRAYVNVLVLQQPDQQPSSLLLTTRWPRQPPIYIGRGHCCVAYEPSLVTHLFLLLNLITSHSIGDVSDAAPELWDLCCESPCLVPPAFALRAVLGRVRTRGGGRVARQTHAVHCARGTPSPPCTSTALSKLADPSDRRFSDCSFRFPLMGTALSKHGDPSDRCFCDFQRACAEGRGGYSNRNCGVQKACTNAGVCTGHHNKFYCLRQVHLAENLPQPTHTQDSAKNYINTAYNMLCILWMVILGDHGIKKKSVSKSRPG